MPISQPHSLRPPDPVATIDGLACVSPLGMPASSATGTAMNRLFRSVLAVALCPSIASACEGMLHIEVETLGVYALDHATAIAQQPGLSGCPSDAFALSQAGKPVPIRVVDGGDGRFGDGDRIEFVGQPLHGPASWYDAYSVDNVYQLRVADGAHARMREDAPDPDARSVARLDRTLHFEQENLVIRLDQNLQKPGDEPDLWQWAKLTHADPAPFAMPFDLPDLAPGSGTVDVTLNLRGLSIAPMRHDGPRIDDHVAELSLNGERPIRFAWSGRDEFTHVLRIPASQFKPRGNEIRITLPKRPNPWNAANPIIDVVMFNWAEFRFDIRGDLDGGALPFRVGANGNGAIEVEWDGNESMSLYGLDGVRRSGVKSGTRMHRFAAAPAGIELLPAIDGKFGTPKLVRAVSRQDWHAPERGYDYLIVTHESLRDAIAPLADFHRARGLSVATIDVSDVMDQFNHGIPHPVAIQNLVRHAHAHWPEPKPRFLLLVGDASFDIRNTKADDLRYAKFSNNPHELAYSGHFAGIPATQYKEGSLGFARRNLIPTWQYPSPEGQSASDNPFGTLGDDHFPVVAVGRFPVVEPEEVKAIVDKTIDYMAKPRPGQWRRDVMFITDESDYFKQSSDQLADTLAQDGFVAGKIYASKDEADNLAHQGAIKQGLNDGQLLVHFVGHGGRYIWRTGPPDIRKNHDLFTLDDVSALTNAGRLPMILSMTCYSAPFDNPTEDSIGERFLREADKGAVAVFAASWRNAPSTEYSKRLVTELLTPGATIGEAIVRAKKGINDRTLVEMYNLLGDPAVVLERPRAPATLVLDEDRWNPGVFVALPQAAFDGEVFVDWLDATGKPAQRAHYAIAGNRFRLPVPRATGEQRITGVRVVASSRGGGEDAAARIDLPTPPAATHSDDPAAATAAPAAAAVAPRPSLAPGDVISHAGFESDGMRPLAVAD